jgi:hypothetical protein
VAALISIHQILRLSVITGLVSSPVYANFYSSRPCSLVALMQTQPASNQAMRIYVDHLEMNAQTVHAGYHILSVLRSGVEVNAPVATAQFYLLAEGEVDPELCYTNPMTLEQSESLKIYEFNRG